MAQVNARPRQQRVSALQYDGTNGAQVMTGFGGSAYTWYEAKPSWSTDPVLICIGNDNVNNRATVTYVWLNQYVVSIPYVADDYLPIGGGAPGQFAEVLYPDDFQRKYYVETTDTGTTGGTPAGSGTDTSTAPSGTVTGTADSGATAPTDGTAPDSGATAPADTGTADTGSTAPDSGTSAPADTTATDAGTTTTP